MDNMTDSLLETYLFETNSLLEQLDELLINAEKAGEFTSDDVNEIFRSMHTIKGSSAMLEFQPLMEVAHHIEDLFFFIRENGTGSLTDDQKSELFNLMFKSTDRLRADVEKVENNEPLSMNIDSFVNEINSFLNELRSKDEKDAPNAQSDTGQAGDPGSETSSGKAPKDIPDMNAPYIVHVFFEEDCGMENLRSFMLITALKDTDLEFSFTPEDVETNSDTSDVIAEQGFYLAFLSQEEAESAIKIISTTSNIRSYELIERPQDVQKEEAPAAKQSSPSEENKAAAAPAASKQPSPAGHAKQSLISVNLSKLDQLMAIVGEIVITESMVTASPELQNVKLDSFLKSARQLRKLTDDLQDIAMSLRMVSVSGVFQKMNRIVRDMKKTLNKDVRLTIVGEDTEVDKTIVDSIGDPIMHIVRNAMDHGIEEDVQTRISAGKPPQGEIKLSARHTGSEVIITVEDDGQGMDTDAILAKAARNGILTKPEEEYSKKEILSLLMLPGFSTNQEVTEYSGRGVGLDVVRKNVEAIGGTVSITSEKGQGSCTTLKIPLTLAIVNGMEISIGKNVFTIPIAHIRQSFKAEQKDIILDASGHEMIKCMDEFFPIVRIHDMFNMEEGYTNIEDGILIWVEASDKSYCMFVDQLLGEQQVVVKPLPSYLNNFNIKHSGISGCTILGDGNISIILDVASVYTAAQEMF
ncbi:chemotaxis protein CheA [[Clostridium] hylemonae]|uniref:Chemotaxis protein CheA n=1 Tax=[Clostridium] hylemonae DSM 15053 TaxID=553973 RepID=C0C1R7_9FIRM|nr:chemotaxis protein CheA [[Clostridium] hylemonae]EEG74081.1 ATPase/histidine kinase/DNA gyrase B/HSP90 domain protein [[Clostridium] hylemonae DSM 15053]QEK19464.1 Chemotaxis protein CheA [[Clostridium] hylemonae DSM 15053]